MQLSKEKIKQICLLMVFAAALVILVMHSSSLGSAIANAFGIAMPFIAGGAIAFVLNIPMRFVEGKLLKKWKGKVADKCKRPIAMLLSVIFIVLIINLVVITVVPQVTEAVTVLGKRIPVFTQQVEDWLSELSEEYPQLQDPVAMLEEISIDWSAISQAASGFLKSGLTNMLSSTFTVASSIVSGVVNFFIAFFFALYILAQKEKLGDQGRRILSAYLPDRIRRSVEKVLALLYKNFSSFITGQCLEAVILGTLFVISMSIFRMPYAVMIGVLIAFTALIPIVGAFIGCVVGAFLILTTDPMQAIWFVVLFIVLQQIEGNLIYPRVVGGSVGLPSIWVLMAVTVGGSLFGIAGMLVFIPLMSTLYALLRENVNKRNARKAAVSAEENAAAGEPAQEEPAAVMAQDAE